jgi:hypothetical protein
MTEADDDSQVHQQGSLHKRGCRGNDLHVRRADFERIGACGNKCVEDFTQWLVKAVLSFEGPVGEA